MALMLLPMGQERLKTASGEGYSGWKAQRELGGVEECCMLMLTERLSRGAKLLGSSTSCTCALLACTAA